MRKFKQEWVAGKFIATSNSEVSSLGALNTAGAFTAAGMTVNSMTGAAGWRGIATVTSGTAVASVAATAARSGAVIQLTKYMGADQTNSGSNLRNYAVESVRAGAFEIRACGSVCPTADQPIVWTIIR